MRLVTLRREDGTTRAGRVEDGEIVELPFEDVGTLLWHHPDWERVAAEWRGPAHELATADLAQPVLFPPKIIGVGLNYVSHIQEMGNEPPKHPIFFAKYARALTGPRDPIVLPAGVGQSGLGSRAGDRDRTTGAACPAPRGDARRGGLFDH